MDNYPDDSYLSGVEVLMMGWLGPVRGEFRWYANLIFLYVTYKLFTGTPIFGKWLLSLAMLLSAATMLFPYHRNTYGQFRQVHSSFGIRSFENIIAFEVGVYFWAASLLIAAAGILVPNKTMEPTR